MSGEKRSQDSEDTLHAETVIIVDIEGTTSSISFVKETLFPYVKENLKQYIEKNWDTEELKADLEKLKEQAKKDETDKVEGAVSITGATPEEERESLVKNVLWQMDGDRKTGALKQLQGHIWREGYKSGAIKGHVYEDVPKAFDGWTKSGRKIYVYSSGSVEAQKLLFGHSEHGDITKYLSDYFDTEIGAKQETSSYKNMLAKIDVEPSSVMFLTDVVKEAQAAKDAGISAKIVVRPGNAPLTDEEKVTFATIESFMDLSFQTSAKRQKVEKVEEKEVIASKPEAPVDEPMDTSEEVPAAEPSAPAVAEKVEKSGEKIVTDESKKSALAEPAKVEKAKPIDEKSSATDGSMEVDSKVAETEKKAPEAVEKPVVPDETKTKEEEPSKTTSDKSAPSNEAPAVCEIAKKETEKPTAKSAEESVVAKPEIVETPKKEVEVAKKETEAAAKKSDDEVAKKDSETTKAEEAPPVTAAKTESEPMDEDKTNTQPSKSETNATTTEDKTEACAKKPVVEAAAKAEPRNETEASKPIIEATVTETNTAAVEDAKTSCPVKAPSTESPSTEVAKPEKKTTEDKSSVEKTEIVTEVAPKATEKIAESSDKTSSPDDKAKGDTKQNGESAKKDETQSSSTAAEKKETTSDVTESSKSEQVASPVATTETTKTEKIEEKTTTEPMSVESAKKKDTEAEAKTSPEEASKVVAESNDPKLNGMTEDTDKNENEKPHRNGLNGDTSSSTEKSNGDTAQNDEAAAATSSSQNGEAEESSTGAAASATAAAAASSAESIKAKKVVDSTIVDGAGGGEPDVVPPVAVAATS